MSEPLVVVRGLEHTYLPGTSLATPALRGVDLTVQSGEIVSLVGANGAGKSTLLRYLNGLFRPKAEGQVMVLGQDTGLPDCDLPALRRRSGLVGQHPHQQLFERYVGDDVAFGPRQLGLDRADIRERVYASLAAVGLEPAAFVDRHTFSLSGGEMRRVALAGVLALQPRVLLLDEATTGLDPRGRAEVHALLRRLRAEQGLTVLLVTNDMDEAAELADRVAVLHQGRIAAEGPAREVLCRAALLARCGLEPPSAVAMAEALAEAGLPLPAGLLTLGEVEEAIWRLRSG